MKPEYQIPLWRDRRGETMFRVFAALAVDELCRQAGLPTEELVRRLRIYLGRSLSRQTLAAWRRADQAVPAEVIFALSLALKVAILDAQRASAMRVLADKEADPEFAGVVRLYFGQGRFQMPDAVPSTLTPSRGAYRRRLRSPSSLCSEWAGRKARAHGGVA